jgi:hypothetical protein
MFGWFAKKGSHPELSATDQLIIAERKNAHEDRYKIYLRRERLRWGDEAARAVAEALLDEARERARRADAEYAAMMDRLKAQAREALAAQEPRP